MKAGRLLVPGERTMPYQLPPDVQDQVSRQIATGHYASKIEDMEAGRLRPFDDFDADLRKQFGFAADR